MSSTTPPSEEAVTAPPIDLPADFPLPTYEDWRALAEKDLKGADFEKKLVWKTPEGIPVQPIYTRRDVEDKPLADNLPGFAPYTRGAYPLSGVNPEWQIRQDLMLASPEEVNAAALDSLARGQTAIGIRLDNAARRGLDGNDPKAAELAGRGGTTLSSINGMRIALDGIDLSRVPVTFRTDMASLPVLAQLLAYAEETKVPRKLISGAVECDPLRDLAKYGRVRGSMSLEYRKMADMVTFCARECPGLRPVMVNSHTYHNAGSSAVEELAFTMASATEYLRVLTEKGIKADTAALSMIFSFSVSTNLFMEIAKLRAARTLWAKIVAVFGAEDPEAGRMFLHARTSSYTKTRNDPYNNMIRSAIEGFAAAVGGANSLYIAPFDETIGRPDEFGMRVARNQQLILQHEAYLTRVVDPSAGSYYVEELTDSVARHAWALLQEVEAAGGMLEALKAGLVQKRIEGTAERRRTQVAQRRTPIIGVSTYPNPAEKPVVKQHLARKEFLAERERRLARLKSVRHNSVVRNLLSTLTTCVYTGDGNLMEVAVGAAREGATIGEICDAMARGATEESEEVTPIRAERASAGFERLRDRAAAWAAKNGDALPEVFLVPMGPLAMRRARADFCIGFFGAGGFKVVEERPFDTVEDAVTLAKESAARVFVLCSDDASYLEIARSFVPKLRAERPDAKVVVAGYPEDIIGPLREAGIDDFVHLRANALETLDQLQQDLGIA